MKQIVKTIADKTIEYILGLPNGSNLTIYQAVKAVCPDETELLDELDLYELKSTVMESVKKPALYWISVNMNINLKGYFIIWISMFTISAYRNRRNQSELQ